MRRGSHQPLLDRRPHTGQGVDDVEVAPALAHGHRVGPAVTGGATVVGHEHGPAAGHEVRDAGLEGDRPLRGGPTVRPDQQRRARSGPGQRARAAGTGARGRRHRRARPSSPGSGSSRYAVPARHRTAGEDGPLPRPGVVGDQLRRGLAAAAHGGEGCPAPGEGLVPALGHVDGWPGRALGGAAGVDVDDAQPAEPQLVARKAMRRPSGDQAKLRWPWTQVGDPCSAGSATSGRARAVGTDHRDVQPPRRSR